MIIGQTIVAVRKDGTTTHTVVYSPWFARQGDGITSVFEVIAINPDDDAKLEVQLFHKNTDETGEGSGIGAGTSLTSVDVATLKDSALKQLLRYQVTLTDGPNASVDQLFYCHFRLLQPSFQATGIQDI